MRWATLIAVMLVGCAAEPDRSAVAAPPNPAGIVAVLVAGDGSEPVFDDAVTAMADRLATRGASITRLSADPRRPDGATRTSLSAMLGAVAAMRPAPGQGCVVFATSHGAHDGGFLLATHDNPLEGDLLYPAALDRALSAGCGTVPTVVVMSGCFSGGFARGVMRRPNRIILTAARPDRPSFGCGSGLRMTFFDGCLLASMDRAPTWVAAAQATRACVADAEAAMDVQPSEPQTYVGAGVRDLALPVTPPLQPANAQDLVGAPS